MAGAGIDAGDVHAQLRQGGEERAAATAHVEDAPRPEPRDDVDAAAEAVEERAPAEEAGHGLASVEGREAPGPVVEVGVEFSRWHGCRSRFRIAR